MDNDNTSRIDNNGRSVRLVQIAPNGATGIDKTSESSNPQIVKTFKNGQLLILRDGETYNAQGARVE